jgi:hypothetical protein
MYIKQAFRIIQHFKRHMIIFFLIGSMVSLGEYLLLTYIREIYTLLLAVSGSSILAIAGLAVGYLVILATGFLLIYKTRKQAFSMAMQFILHLVAGEKKNDFVRNPEGLSRVLTVERERLAREVVSPILSIMTKIMMPVLVCGYIVIGSPISVGTLALPAVILILAFIVSSSMFAHFARKLEVGLEELGLFTHTFMRTYDSSARKIDNSNLLYKASVANKSVANSEGYIDLFSQLPRQSIDFSIYVFILFGLLSDPNAESELTSLLFLSPLLLRGLSSIQVIYKCFASIKSNVGSLSVLSGEAVVKNREALPLIEKKRVSINIHKRDGLTIDNIGETGRTLGIQLPSGYGKTNAILNLLYSDLNLPSAMVLEVIGCDVSDIGYVPSDPFFDGELLETDTRIDPHFEIFFDDLLRPSSTDPLKCSAGELFRWNLYVEMANNPRLLILDESIIHASQVHQRKILEYFSSGKTSTSLILITHSRELVLQCALQIC